MLLSFPQKVATFRPRASGSASRTSGTFRGPRSPVFRAASPYSHLRVRYVYYCGNVRVVAAVSRLKFFLTYRLVLVLCYNRNTPPNFAFVGIFYYGMPVRSPHKILAILASLTPMATCITSQVALSQNRKIFLHFLFANRLAYSVKSRSTRFAIFLSLSFQRTACIVCKPCCHGRPVSRPPVRFYRPSGLPCFQAVLPGRFFSMWYRAVLNSGPFMFRRRRKTRMSYLALSSL